MSRWLLLRGLTRDSHHWGGFPAALAEAGDQPATAIDLPGNGRLWQMPSPADVPAMAAHCASEAERLGLAPPYRLVAVSLGGMVAIEWVRRRPQDFASLTLVNCSARPYCRASQRLDPRAWPTLLRALLPGQRVEALEARVLALTSCLPPHERGATLADWIRWRHAHPVSRANLLRQLLAAVRFAAPPAAPHPRTRLIAGGGDRLVSPECSRRLAEAWRVPLTVHPWAGHDLPLDDPAWLIVQLLSDPTAQSA